MVSDKLLLSCMGAQTLPLVQEALHWQMLRLAKDIGGPAHAPSIMRRLGVSSALLMPEAELLIVGTDTFDVNAGAALTRLGLRHQLDIVLLRAKAKRLIFDFFFHKGFRWSNGYTRWAEYSGVVFVPVDPHQRHLIQAGQRGLIVTQIGSSHWEDAA